MLHLSELIGTQVRSADGEVVGRLVDVTVEVGADHPALHRVAVGRRRRVAIFLGWETVSAVGADVIQLDIPSTAIDGGSGTGELESHELRLVRDILDTQIVDIAGKRFARVSEILVADGGPDETTAIAVDIGAGAIWRRLGLRRIGARLAEDAVDWVDLHLTSQRGRAIQLSTSGSGVQRLGPAELAALVARLPMPVAAHVLGVVSAASAAGALQAAHPSVGARLLETVPTSGATSMVEEMEADDAAAVLRRLPSGIVEEVLGGVASERAETLRRLLDHRADSAGGLMNTAVRTARAGERVEEIRERLVAGIPEQESLATVFVIDDDGRPVGSYEPNDLLAGRSTPKSVPAVPLDLPVERVVDLFALHDYLALPVVDGEGRLVGMVTIDDVFEELVAERLPGQHRYARIRQRVRRARPRRHRRRRPGRAP